MMIEITGAGFSNKGAQLMLATVCERLRRAAADTQLCIPKGYGTYEDRGRYGLRMALPASLSRRHPKHVLRHGFYRMVGKTALGREAGLVPADETDGIIDISGYAFGDKWPAAKTDRLLRPARACKRRGKPVVMLPQMLGPFTRPGQASAFKALAEQVDLIYAREQESYEHARPLVDPAKLRMAPDITITSSPRTPPPVEGPYACVVPNSKMLEANPQQQDWRAIYMDRLVVACRHLAKRGLDLRIVQHEYDSGDSKLVDQLSHELRDARCETVRDPDPHVLKGVLGGAELVIASRYHSLVSTLSMGVPAIALGWAHKYEALLRDFGTPEQLHYAHDSEEDLLALIDRSLKQHDELAATLVDRKVQLTNDINGMWSEVFDLFGMTAGPEGSSGHKGSLRPRRFSEDTAMGNRQPVS